MAISVSVFTAVELVEEDDGTFSVNVKTSSQSIIHGNPQNPTPPTVRRSWKFPTKSEAEKCFAEVRMKYEKVTI